MRNAGELRPYQQRIATFLYEHDEALVVARPGGGKTVAAATAFSELKQAGVVRHALVIAPKRVANNVWPDEIRGWSHTCDLSVDVLDGGPITRHEMLHEQSRDVTVIGIDLVGWLIDNIEGLDEDHPVLDLLIIDEISKLRNPTGVRAKLLAKHAHRWKMIWGLTGTLRPNSALDLFMPARVVTRGKLWGRSFYQWRQERFYPTDFKGYNWTPKPCAEDIINSEIAPHIVTLNQDEYPQLPDCSIVFDYINLPGTARNAYDTMHRKLVADTRDKRVVAANAAVATGKLAQIANGFLYADGEDDATSSAIKDVVELHDEKREWLADVIEQATGPTLLVYEYIHDLRMMQELLPGLRHIGAGVGGGNAVAAANIRDWNAGRLKFMALHPAAAGHGLNLQAGGCDMAWIAPTWSPELWEQTIARLHRSGQTKPVIVRVCVGRDTVDQMKLDRVHYKMTAQAAFEKYLASRETRAAK
jgi:hypothetical protein